MPHASRPRKPRLQPMHRAWLIPELASHIISSLPAPSLLPLACTCRAIFVSVMARLWYDLFPPSSGEEWVRRALYTLVNMVLGVTRYGTWTSPMAWRARVYSNSVRELRLPVNRGIKASIRDVAEFFCQYEPVFENGRQTGTRAVTRVFPNLRKVFFELERAESLDATTFYLVSPATTSVLLKGFNAQHLGVLQADSILCAWLKGIPAHMPNLQTLNLDIVCRCTFPSSWRELRAFLPRLGALSRFHTDAGWLGPDALHELSALRRYPSLVDVSLRGIKDTGALLQGITPRNFSNFRNVALRGDCSAVTKVLENIRCPCTAMKLRVGEWRDPEYSSALDVRCLAQAISGFRDTLRTLVLAMDSDGEGVQMSFRSLEGILRCRNIRDFSLEYHCLKPPQIDNHDVAALARAWPYLSDLSLLRVDPPGEFLEDQYQTESASGLTLRCLLPLAQSCPFLESLSLWALDLREVPVIPPRTVWRPHPASRPLEFDVRIPFIYEDADDAAEYICSLWPNVSVKVVDEDDPVTEWAQELREAVQMAQVIQRSAGTRGARM